MNFSISGINPHPAGVSFWVTVQDIAPWPANAANYKLMARFTNLNNPEDEWIVSQDGPFDNNEHDLEYTPDGTGLYNLKVEVGTSYNDTNNEMQQVDWWDPAYKTIQIKGVIEGGVDPESSIPGGVVQLSGNPITIKLKALQQNVTKDNYQLLLQVVCDDLLGSPLEEVIAPNSKLESVFNISGLVDQPLDVEFQNPPIDKIIAHPALSRNVTINSGEVYLDENGDRQTNMNGEIQGVTMRIIKGKLRDYELALMNEEGETFNSKYILSGRFLTHLPQNMKVSPDQVIKLWFMSRWAEDHAATLHLEVENTADYEYSVTQDFVIAPASGLIEFNINARMYGFIPQVLQLSADTQVTALNFWLSDANGDISERRRFVVDNRYYPKQYFFYYRNSLSAIDSLWLHGEYTEHLKTDTKTAYQPLPEGAGTQVGSLVTVASSGQRYWELNTGIKRVEEIRAMRDFLEARYRWMADPERQDSLGPDRWRLIPVIIEGNDHEIDKSRNKTPSLEIKIMEGYSQ